MTVAATRADATPNRLVARLADGICRRAFSSPEALAYEATIASALADVVVPTFLDRIAGHLILDVGCGGGTVAAQIARLRAARVVGVDPSASQAKRFERRARAGATISGARAGVEALPFRDATFDSVISSCAWKHWPTPMAGVIECTRVLRPGGVLVVVEIDGSSTPEEFWQFAKRSRVPFGMKHAYVRFAMRTVIGVAPDIETFERSFESGSPRSLAVDRIEGMPFLVATLST